MDDRDGKRETLADAERQVLGALIDMVGKAEALDQFGDARLPFRTGRWNRRAWS